MAVVHYKFKNSVEYDSLTFDGLAISLRDLKTGILKKKHMRSEDTDLQIVNAQNGEEYSSPSMMIPKNTSLIIARIPVGGIKKAEDVTPQTKAKKWAAFRKETQAAEEQRTEASILRKRTRHALVFEDVETESPASMSDEDIVIHRGRGRGRGSGRGRGRGRRQRGGRLFRGRQFEEVKEEKLVRLHEERRQKADDMIDRLTDGEKTSMLKEVAERQPSVILDVAAILSTRDEGPHEPGPSVPVPSWCFCPNCPPMDRDEDKLCCGMAPQYCNSRRPEMGISITDPLTLHLQQTFRDDVFARQAESLEDTNRAFRHAAYRQYVLWVFGQLHRDDRRTVPACCVQVLRDKFPSPGGDYTGFIPSTHGIGWELIT